MASFGHVAVGMAAARIYRGETATQRASWTAMLLWIFDKSYRKPMVSSSISSVIAREKSETGGKRREARPLSGHGR